MKLRSRPQGRFAFALFSFIIDSKKWRFEKIFSDFYYLMTAIARRGRFGRRLSLATAEKFHGGGFLPDVRRDAAVFLALRPADFSLGGFIRRERRRFPVRLGKIGFAPPGCLPAAWALWALFRGARFGLSDLRRLSAFLFGAAGCRFCLSRGWR